ncbi:MAG: hypothetical protein HOO97_06700 [Sideroxydans sp.]|nr:hypothetical protein [Sideroxydans sp.]
MENQIISAIKEKKILTFTYKGYPRVVEPHVYGIHEGTRQLLGYQIRGSSKSGGVLPEWRRFGISEMQNLQMLSETFPGRRANPSGERSHWDQKIMVVE